MHYFLFNSSGRRCFWAVSAAAGFKFDGRFAAFGPIKPDSAAVPRALGFRGDNAPALDAGGGSGTILLANGISPVTLLLIVGWPVGVDRPILSIGSLSGKPRMGDVSFPSVWRRAFSCFACTERK